MVLDKEENRQIVDLLRAFGIFMVFLFHVCFIIGGLATDAARERFVAGFPNLFSFIWQPFGVDLIFLISAFLLSYAMLQEHSQTGSISLRNHFLRRMTRILPLYYFALIFYAVPQGASWDWFLAAAFFIAEQTHRTTIISVGWSTEALIQAYVALPFILMFVASRQRPMLWVFGLGLSMLAWRFGYMVMADEDWSSVYLRALARSGVSNPAENIYVDIWFRSIAIWMGIGLALAVLRHGELLAKAFERKSVQHMVLAGILLTFLAANCVPIHDVNAWSYQKTGEWFWIIFIGLQSTIACLNFVLILLYVFYRPGGVRFPVWLTRASARLSKDIFGFYLFHYFFLLLAVITVFWSVDREALLNLTVWHFLAITVLGFVVSLGFAMLVGRYFERPAQKWLRKKLEVKSNAVRKI